MTRVSRLLRPIAFATLVLVGACSSDEGSPQSCAYSVTQDLDAGRFDAALERLDSRACEGAMTREQIEIDRAAAYIGRAGYDIADILLALLDVDAGGDGEPDGAADVRVLEALAGLGRPGGITNLARANAAYARMMEAFTQGLDEACRRTNANLLSELQRDACFHSGLIAFARLTRGFDLLLGGELAAFLGRGELDCENDRNASGVVDEAEITACALQARSSLAEGSGVCLEPGTSAGQPRGGISWSRIAGVEAVPFFENGAQFASVVPIRVTTEAGGACAQPRRDVRLLQPRPERSPEVLVTGGRCEVEITQSCPAVDSAMGCWPCPVPRLETPGAVSVGDALLDAINIEAERLLGVVTEADRTELRAELEDIRVELCAEVEGTSAECTLDADGELSVSRDAIREYLRQ